MSQSRGMRGGRVAREGRHGREAPAGVEGCLEEGAWERGPVCWSPCQRPEKAGGTAGTLLDVGCWQGGERGEEVQREGASQRVHTLGCFLSRLLDLLLDSRTKAHMSYVPLHRCPGDAGATRAHSKESAGRGVTAVHLRAAGTLSRASPGPRKAPTWPPFSALLPRWP